MKENEFDVVPLREALEKFDQENVRKVLNGFVTNSDDKDVEDFLKHKAISFENSGDARTSLVFKKINHQQELVGYFSLVTKPLSLSAKHWNKLTEKTRKKLAGRSKNKIAASSSKEVRGVLLGQLGKNCKFQTDVTGSKLLELAEKVALDIWNIGGGKLLWLEANDNDKLTEFYEKNEYTRVVDNKGATLKNQNEQNFFIKLFDEIDESKEE